MKVRVRVEGATPHGPSSVRQRAGWWEGAAWAASRRGEAQRSCCGGASSHLQDARDAKVAELGRAVATHEDVLRLEVAVQHAHLVHVLEPCGKLDEPVHELFLRQFVLPFRLGFLPPPGEHRAQIAASRQLHQDADRPRLRKRCMIADYVRVL